MKRPFVLLLLALTALLAPATPSSATVSATAAVRHVASSHVAPARPAGGRAEHHAVQTEITRPAVHPPAPVHSTAAADRRPGAPQLLLVQRPRPPTTGFAVAAVGSPTGRSPPSPAGT